jgi:hypothetical protein
MANGDGQSRNIVPQGQRAPSVVTLGPLTTLDLSFLSDEVREQLMKDYARGVLDVAKKAHELHVDVDALKAKLDTFSQTAKEVSKDGNAVTITNTNEDTSGRTEIIIGNTKEAQTGKLTKSQTGERDWTPYYIFAAIAAVILIAFLFAGRH